MKSIRYFSIGMCILPMMVFGQYEVDALRFSRSTLNGSAKFISMGGAMGAVGADFSVMSSNPGGLGLFRSSQISFTPGFNFAQSESQWEQNNFSDRRFAFQFGQVGGVFHKKLNRPLPMGTQGFTFAIGYNRTHSFNRSLTFEGENNTHSLGDLFLQRANGLGVDQLDAFTERLGFDTFLLDTLSGGQGNQYTNLGLFANENKNMSRQITAKGSAGEIGLAGAVNLGHRLYIGATLGIVRLDYTENSEYTERDRDNLVPGFNQVLFRENLMVEGTGIHVKAGLVWRVADWFRVGAAIHSPTFMALTEQYSTEMVTDFNVGTYTSNSPRGNFDYDLDMPWRWNASVAFIIAQKLTLAAEYEMADFSNISLRSTGNFFTSTNQFIDANYGLSHHLRVGGEFRIDPWRFRAGYQHATDPVIQNGGVDRTIQYFTAGMGYRAKKWVYFDIAYVLQKTQGNERIFRDFTTTTPAIIELNQHLAQVTLGFIF
jgi:hypothetical protein